jgi:hypothetical protein
VLGADPSRPRRERAFGAGASAFERQLSPLAGRLRRRRTLEYLPYALALAASVALVFGIAGRLFALPGLFAVGFTAALALAALAVVRVAQRRVGPYEAARSVDASLSLRERLATALELLDGRAEGPLVERQVRDAVSALGAVTPKQAFPYFPAGSLSRQLAARRGGYAAVALAVAVALAAWPSPAANGTATNQGDKLALAQPQRDEDNLQTQLSPQDTGNGVEGVEGLTQRPNDVGDLSGALTENKPNQGANGTQPGAQSSSDPNQQAQQDARSQQNSSVADRQQALQDLGNSLRQSQTARQAADSLRRGDTQKAAQQLNQVADQASKLSPGERQSLSQAFQQAADQIGSRDPVLADASKRAADALSQFRTQDAQKAIRDSANEVAETGRQAQQQQDLQQRAQDIASGGQPQLPQQQLGNQQGQQDQQSPQSQAAQGQNGATRQGGENGQASNGLSDMEAELRSGGLQNGNAGGNGAGSGAGSGQQSAPQRLNVEARTVTVDAQVGDGPTQWRPPSPNAAPAPAGASGSGAAVPSGPVSAAPVGAGADVNNVPWDLASSVRQYFTPDQANQASK